MPERSGLKFSGGPHALFFLDFCMGFCIDFCMGLPLKIHTRPKRSGIEFGGPHIIFFFLHGPSLKIHSSPKGPVMNCTVFFVCGDPH